MKHIVMNPQIVPVVQIDSDLPALPADILTLNFLRASFKKPPLNWEAVPNEQPLIVAGQAVRKAAVLMPLVRNRLLTTEFDHPDAAGFSILLMQRSMSLQDHPGQISLPGGKAEEGDLDSIETALRETHEEIGIAPEQVEVLGVMPEYTSISGFDITPVVGVVQKIESLTLCRNEVMATFTVPLSFLMDPANHRWHLYRTQTENGQEVTRRWLSMEYVKDGKSYYIWGITAAIIRNFYLYLQAYRRDLCGSHRL